MALNANSLLIRAQLTASSLAANSTEEQLLLQRLAGAQAELAKTRIYAPFTGRIQTRDVEPGDLVQPSKVLLEIARLDNQGLEVVVALDEKNFAPLQLNQSVQLIADAWPEQTVAGVVSFIAPAVDSSRGTIDVHIRVLDDAEQANAFLPGMTVSANIKVAEHAATLVLPNDYLWQKDGQPQVLRWQAGKLAAVKVQVGLRNQTHSEITAGLQQGDTVVQADASQIDTLLAGRRARVHFE